MSLTLEFGSAWVVRPVHLHMAIQTSATGGLGVSRTATRRQDGVQTTLQQARRTTHRGAVVTAMALLTQIRCARFEQWRIDRTVWRMAITAVVGDRRVFPKEGATFFGMTGVAGVIYVVLQQELGTRGAVRVVAIGTSHLAGIQGMGRVAVGLRAF